MYLINLGVPALQAANFSGFLRYKHNDFVFKVVGFGCCLVFGFVFVGNGHFSVDALTDLEPWKCPFLLLA